MLKHFNISKVDIKFIDDLVSGTPRLSPAMPLQYLYHSCTTTIMTSIADIISQIIFVITEHMGMEIYNSNTYQYKSVVQCKTAVSTLH